MIPLPDPVVVPVGVDERLADRVAAEVGLRRAAVGVSSPSERVVLLFDGAMAASLRELSRDGVLAMIEVDPDDVETAVSQVRRVAAVGGAVLGCTTRSALAMEPARLFVELLTAAREISEDARIAVESALQEAVTNALVHGNLEISSESFDVQGGLCCLEELLEERKRQPELAGRRLVLAARQGKRALEVTVENEGPGYQPQEDDAALDGQGFSGRGLGIIRAFAEHVDLSDNGRIMRLTFQI